MAVHTSNNRKGYASRDAKQNGTREKIVGKILFFFSVFRLTLC